MPYYYGEVEATTNPIVNLVDSFVAVTAASGQIVQLSRFTVSVPGLPPGVETALRVQVTQRPLLGTGSISSQPVRLSPMADTSASALGLKSGATAFSGGVVSYTVRQLAINMRSTYEWVPTSIDEMPTCAPGQTIGLDLSAATSSVVVRVECEWKE